MNPFALVRRACHPFGRRRLLHRFCALPDHQQLSGVFLLIVTVNGLLLGLALLVQTWMQAPGAERRPARRSLDVSDETL